MLTQFLTGLRGHVLVRYPEVQMERLPFETGSFDVVLHSDTLEHVQNPMDGLAESGRVLRPGGSLIFTVPLVSSRLSKRRSDEEPPSFHGTPGNDEFRVVTEYGADIWADVLEAGFGDCALVSFDRRGGVSIVARWPTR